jgi:spermidine synthase
MPPFLLLAAVAIEGYVVLAAELLAIRQLTPFVGTGTDTIAIVIAAVLLPLALGYEAGGRAGLKAGDEAAVRRRLSRNLLAAAAILVVGLSHPTLVAFFETIAGLGIRNRLGQTAVYATFFLAVPVYLLGQTVPLVGFCAPRADLPRFTGHVLFLSTLGSFLGSIVSTLVLMAFWGVHNTVILTLSLLLALVALVSWPVHRRHVAAAAALVLCVAAFNNGRALERLGIVGNNQYSQVRVVPVPGESSRLMIINNSLSSKIAADPARRFPYVAFIEDEVLTKLPSDRPQRILVVGAGGFTMGLSDAVNRYTFVDIDPSLKAISEEHFLRRELGPNKTFVAEPARAFLRRNGEPFDLVVLDAYSSGNDIPQDLVTREWFAAVRGALAPGGAVVMNVIASPSFADRFSRSLDATIRSVFPFVSRQIILGGSGPTGNVIYLAFGRQDRPHEVYTDDRNRVFLDR